jgi:hypothetical protein
MFFLFVDMPVGKVGQGDARWNYAFVLLLFMFYRVNRPVK